ncbi:MAG: PBSX family phage terminase large subunit [Cetobacterium sp.]
MGIIKIKMSEQVAPSFKEPYEDIKNHRYTHYVFKGGRGSTKSSFVVKIIPILLMSNKNYNAVILRKVHNTLKKSVYNNILWALEELGIRHLFKATVSPLEVTYIPTGQKIVFLGCDDPTKVKSIKFENGYPAIVFYEELDQFSGIEEIRNLNQSLLRGGDKFWCFMAYNPPKSKNNWVNEEMLIPQDNRKVYHSTYLDVPKDWLGELFFIEAEHLKNKNEMSYRHEYLGEATGTGGGVFDNVVVREITEEEIRVMDRFYYGNDFGFAVDPNSFGKFYFHNNKLWILDEIYSAGLSNKALYDKIKAKGITNEIITCDSAEPRTINELRNMGLNVFGAKKGPDSVEHGIKWLQSLDEIIIDKRRTPNAAKEFIGYEYDMNKEGQFISRFPDKNNHFIDCTRYALESLMKQAKWGW